MRLLDLEILILPLVFAVSSAVLVPRRIGPHGELPASLLGGAIIAGFSLVFIALPLGIRAFDPGRRSSAARYVLDNLLAVVAICLTAWCVRAAILRIAWTIGD
jgi:hypothetical protein